ncbi:MAG: hypothetical protein ACREL5_06245, partial [Gemmatimonadales bacterium]
RPVDGAQIRARCASRELALDRLGVAGVVDVAQVDGVVGCRVGNGAGDGVGLFGPGAVVSSPTSLLFERRGVP